MKFIKGFWTVAAFSLCLGVASCSDDDDENTDDEQTGGAPTLVVNGTEDGDTPVLLLSGEKYELEFRAENAQTVTASDVPEGWQVTVDQEKGNVVVTAPEATAEVGKTYTLQLTASGADNQSVTSEEIEFYHLTFDDPKGAFVLNEGNMSSENGMLIYITPEGYIVDKAYRRVNGTELGNVAQGMCFHDGKIYIISQNGDTNAMGVSFNNDGVLVVADARTLKKVRAFTNEELSQLDWPTHVAVLDEQHVYIRDKQGIWRLNMEDGSLHPITLGSYKAPQAPFAVVNGKVYTYYNGGFMVGLYEISPESDTARQIGSGGIWWQYIAITGIAAAGDGKLWIMGYENQASPFISKYDIASGEYTKQSVTTLPNLGYDFAGIRFSAYGDLIYYLDGTTVHRLNFETGDDEVMTDLSSIDENAAISYNGLGVNPVTGYVYANTIKDVGPFFTTNSIWVFDFDASLDEPLHKFDNYTRFPAGVFFNN